MIGRFLIMSMVLLAHLRTVFGVDDHRRYPYTSSLLRRGRNMLETCDCNDFNDYTLDTCDEINGCIHTCIDDGNACTTQSLETDSCAPQDINVAAACDDLNDNTTDSCSPDVGCVHACDDNNECTDDSWDAIKGQCVFETKICDDSNLWTLDICLPSGGGCKFLDFSSIDLDSFELYYQENIENLPENTYFYEDQTTLSDTKIESIINWMTKKEVLHKTPFCYKKTEGRGVGKVLSTCPKPKQKLGALCYSPCRSGYSRQGTFDCQQICKAGWRDDGLFCRKTEYGRGAGYPWKFGDPLNDSRMFRRCEADYGRGNCEKWGLVVYPKCRSGYSPAGCCICRPPRPNCAAEGYNSPGFDLSCPVKIVLGDPTPLICAAGLEQDGALCYPPCPAGYNGIGPMCWQNCAPGISDCGVACARDTTTCVTSTIDMVLSPLILAVNIGTLGLASAPTTALRTVTIGAKTVQYSGNVGFAMLNLAKRLRTINIPDIPKGATVIKRAAQYARPGLPTSVASSLYGSLTVYSLVYAKAFEELTSSDVASTLSQALEPKDAHFIMNLWGNLQFHEIQADQSWDIAQTTLDAVSLVDVTGLTGLIAAYANPKCLDVVPFPNLEALNSPPRAVCEDIEITADLESSCEGSVAADIVGAKSFDPDGDLLTYSLSGGPFKVEGSPHTVTLTVKDRDSVSATCSAKITVIDPTDAVVSCPTAIAQGTDPDTCSSVVTYAAPGVIDNCQSRSDLEQTGGFGSGSAFPLGETQNTYQVTTFPGGEVSFCNFNVNIFDVQAPTISCDGLATTLDTEPGLCSASYDFAEPVATDNCEYNFDPEEFEAGVYVVQTTGMIQAQGQPFPLGTTTNTYEASDNEGNLAECSFDVAVVDKEVPSISCPSSIVIAAIEFCDKAFVKYTHPVASDNCSVKDIVLISGQATDTYFPLGVTTVTWTATDGSGNQNSCSFDVSVVEDLDADRTKDCVDNCPTVYNPDQSDTDLDKIGDACDALLCNNCWPGTSGPCRQSNSVCHKFSRGKCPVGTRPCQTISLPQCSMCSPGTDGPCQQRDGVCWQKLSSGACPTGTTECRPQ